MYNPELLRDYRYFPGHYSLWHFEAKNVLDLLIETGLQEHHKLIDVGCGPLRVGQYIIMFLNPGNYTGIEPEKSILEASLEKEFRPRLIEYKRPKFIYSSIQALEPELCRVLTEFNDISLAWDVFVHLSPKMLELTLNKIRTKWLINIHIGSKDIDFPCDGTRWSYRHADTRGCFLTQELFDGILERTKYYAKKIPFTIDSRTQLEDNALVVYYLIPNER